MPSRECVCHRIHGNSVYYYDAFVSLGGRNGDGNEEVFNQIKIADQTSETIIDSVLVADNRADNTRKQNTYNLNYRFYGKKGQSLNLDLDYGSYKNTSQRNQPNVYYNAAQDSVLGEVISVFDTPRDIDIYTGKLDYERNFGKGKLGIGTKYSKVSTHNKFEVADAENGAVIVNNQLSNLFDYDENVYAGFVSLSHPLGKRWTTQAGLRAEQTEAVGTLTAYQENLQEAPVNLSYLSWFPNVGVTFKVSEMNSLALNYGRRINRPDYNVLNPFNNQLSELSYQKGNPFLAPEIVNNIELGYTYKYRYNFKLAYSKTIDQITRLIGPDENDPRANFISWANLADQTIYSFNASLPFQFTKKWNAFFNLSASHIDNQADYGDGAVVDVQIFTYSFYQQQTINLPNKFVAEISGYFAGPGVWGGVFKYESSWALNLGLQRKFLNDQLNVKLSANDIFYESGWDGFSEFDGLYSEGFGRWDSRNVNLSVSYNFGNQKLNARKRKTGLESESKRIGQ